MCNVHGCSSSMYLLIRSNFLCGNAVLIETRRFIKAVIPGFRFASSKSRISVVDGDGIRKRTRAVSHPLVLEAPPLTQGRRYRTPLAGRVLFPVTPQLTIASGSSGGR